MARPTKYTPDVVKRITDAIKLGATYELASNYGGIDYQTFNRWMQSKGEFCQAIKDAEGEAVVKWLAKIEGAATLNWQAAAWKLERRYPHIYGRTVNEHTGKDSGPIKHDHNHRDLSIFTDDEIANLAGVAERAKAERVP